MIYPNKIVCRLQCSISKNSLSFRNQVAHSTKEEENNFQELFMGAHAYDLPWIFKVFCVHLRKREDASLCRGKSADPADFCVSMACRGKNCGSRIWLPALLCVHHFLFLEETWLSKDHWIQHSRNKMEKHSEPFVDKLQFTNHCLLSSRRRDFEGSGRTWIWWQFKILTCQLLEICGFSCPQVI